MIELIKQSAVPATVMRSAARGALSVPSEEMIEILVYLSGHHTFGEQAKLALAGFDQRELVKVAASPESPSEVLEYLADPENVRASLLAALVENPSVPTNSLLQLALSHSAEMLRIMAASPRVQGDLAVLRTLHSNHALPNELKAELEEVLRNRHHESSTVAISDDVLEIEEEVAKYVAEHAAEIAAEEAKGFELTELTEDEKRELQVHHRKEHATPEEKKRLSPLQKIAAMTVGERVQLAMKGNREERFILIRDGCKVVSSAVLECPKISDQEIELFASMKNVQETVLRGIAGKRKFMKLYPVVRTLATNPRCPLDVSLPLLKTLLVQDLRALSMNKNVSDTLRKLAFKLFKEKSSTKKES